MSRVSLVFLLVAFVVCCSAQNLRKPHLRRPLPPVAYAKPRRYSPAVRRQTSLNPFRWLFSNSTPLRSRGRPAQKRRPALSPQKRDFKVKDLKSKNTKRTFKAAEDIPGYERFTLSEAILPDSDDDNNEEQQAQKTDDEVKEEKESS
ncbi:hypothetical protein TCAL_01621 [Tigriopus californicus]|uniref:Uncharacterized protein n=1 Tax=Tigriopus californicus TaxID=6832 RepID=A0A553PDP7_TIGCA|nr:uncharacterized protein LOC131876915 isoform X2 [Tigriopus californicus]TRY75802.1 hypothetical protein TCAL_01621 [Tigriopus californicus]|eukprot:TCALIF_01621-PA protein Name:"Protein of unknown function" AED:0.02 eAED:0.02 QI:449/0.66/0.75/0.75/1/1/4/0/146